MQARLRQIEGVGRYDTLSQLHSPASPRGDQFFPRGMPRENKKEADRSRASKTGKLYELAKASDQFEDLAMFEGGAAAKCVRPSWI
ncbi:hypothetical protein, partial [Edaphobacter bradus]|uniref:hypothetical protein n=1 Tax=Edaphobacter bradus TaxID=2259016 RepID=UPI0021E068F6